MKKTCMECDSPNITTETTLSKTVNGIVFSATVRGEHCHDCGEDSIPMYSKEAFELNVALYLAEHSEPKGELHREVRRWLQFEQSELATVYGIKTDELIAFESDDAPLPASVQPKFLALLRNAIFRSERIELSATPAS